MKTLSLPDQRSLEAAEGWLGLGDHVSAQAELRQISPEMQSHPEVLLVEWQINAHSKQWEVCVEIAAALVEMLPALENGWIERSFALHELKRTQEAFDLLLPAEKKFPENWTIPYNLACYCAQLARLSEAKRWLKRAMAIDADTVKREAKDDPDLKPLRDSLRGAP